jgi:hypothetical protein
MYSYSSNIRLEFVSINIRICIRIHIENMKTDMGRAIVPILNLFSPLGPTLVGRALARHGFVHPIRLATY